jgi:glycosyltransferase involved in cell wall biosynthesis
MNQPLLNILIRTSGRPNYFRRLLGSIEKQTYTHYRLIISADNEQTAAYVRAAGHTPVMVTRLERSNKLTFPWNLYLNDLLDQVDDGWIMFIDDDDFYAHQLAFQMIVDHLSDSGRMVVWRMRFPDGRLVPSDDYWGKLPFTRKQIAMPCFAFHSSYKDRVRFDGQRAGDFRMATQLRELCPVRWAKITPVQLSNFGNVGRPVDLQHEQNQINNGRN